MALRELRDSLREDSGGQAPEQGLCTIQPDDLSLRILAFAERYESRYEPTPYTLINEFERRRDFVSTENSSEASTETRVERTDYQTYFCQPLASYPMQEARGGLSRMAEIGPPDRPPSIAGRLAGRWWPLFWRCT